jgi:hypothetical protein
MSEGESTIRDEDIRSEETSGQIRGEVADVDGDDQDTTDADTDDTDSDTDDTDA